MLFILSVALGLVVCILLTTTRTALSIFSLFIDFTEKDDADDFKDIQK